MIPIPESDYSRRYIRNDGATRNYKRRHATVQWWDPSSVWIKCPFCNRIHRHGFVNNYGSQSQSRVSHCYNPDVPFQSYYLDFPFIEATGECHYEINRDRGLFVTVGADLTAFYGNAETERLSNVFAEQLKGKRRWVEATEGITWAQVFGLDAMEDLHSDDPDAHMGKYNRIKHADYQLASGKAEDVHDFLQTSPDSHLFIHGIVNDSGDAALHHAACGPHWEMLALLLENGAEVDAQNSQGLTPLMEAALWGRVDNVKLLLDYGADPALVCLRNNSQLRAIDLARASEENQEERSERAGGLYKEDVDARSKDRKTIENLLFEETESLPNPSRLRTFVFTAEPKKSNIRTLFAMFDVPKEKAWGLIWRGPKYPTVAAMSGFKHSANDERNITISGRSWTSNVLNLYREMNLAIEPYYESDHGIPGQFYACHVEKQLIAWFIDRHLIRTRNDSIGEDAFEDMMGDLDRIKPPVSTKKADIMVCRDICYSCENFVKKVNKKFDLEIRLHGREAIEEAEKSA